MVLITNHSLIFNEIPTGVPVPGQTLRQEASSLDLDAELPTGSVLLKTTCISLDPYLREKMRDPSIKSYVPPFLLGKPLVSAGIAEVVKSSNPKLQTGDHIWGMWEFSEYQVVEEEGLKGVKKVEKSGELSWNAFLGPAGYPGATAWYGLEAIGKPKAGETIFISGCAGAVGIVVAQLCKRKGLKVIGSAGSDSKVEYLKKELGVDVAFNYKTSNAREILAKHPFQLYWDNVGGRVLEDVLATIDEFGRVISCGAISGYNGEPYPIPNLDELFKKSLHLKGFILGKADFSGFFDEIPPLVATGEIKCPEHITYGLDNGEAFVGMLRGDNLGKAIVSFEQA